MPAPASWRGGGKAWKNRRRPQVDFDQLVGWIDERAKAAKFAQAHHVAAVAARAAGDDDLHAHHDATADEAAAEYQRLDALIGRHRARGRS